jgi:hypothetical protein
MKSELCAGDPRQRPPERQDVGQPADGKQRRPLLGAQRPPKPDTGIPQGKVAAANRVTRMQQQRLGDRHHVGQTRIGRPQQARRTDRAKWHQEGGHITRGEDLAAD